MSEMHGFSAYNFCEICGKIYSSGTTCLAHKRQVHDKIYKMKCHICDKGFMSKGDMEGHMNGHTGIKPFVCTICGSAFFYKKTLLRHTRSHHT